MPCPVVSLHDADALARATEVLRSGGLVAVPTETVYGLAADSTNAEAVARIYQAKGRPLHNPLIAHVCDDAMAYQYAEFSAKALMLAASFWPGPLTLVLPSKGGIAAEASAGLPTIALRIPATSFTRRLIGALGHPIVAPSANRSGHVSPTTAQHVLDDLGDDIDLICDAGPCRVGVESTILHVEGADVTLLRHGGVSLERLEALLGHGVHNLSFEEQERPLAPGMMASHYAPTTPLRLNAREVFPDEALLAFGTALPEGADQARMVLNLSERGDVDEAARNLYAHMRELDACGALCIAVMDLPLNGLGEALQDRLSRAAVRD